MRAGEVFSESQTGRSLLVTGAAHRPTPWPVAESNLLSAGTGLVPDEGRGTASPSWRSKPRLRTTMVELAWLWRPASLWFHERVRRLCGRLRKTIIVAVTQVLQGDEGRRASGCKSPRATIGGIPPSNASSSTSDLLRLGCRVNRSRASRAPLVATNRSSRNE